MNEQKQSPEARQLRLIRLQTIMIACILVLILAFVLFLGLKVNTVMEVVEQLDVTQLNAAVASLKAAADKLAAVDIDSLNAGIQGLADAAGQLSQLDFEKLNTFMESLETLADWAETV